MEEWRAIPGFESLYEASNLGRIRTAEGKTTSSARFEKRIWKQRILKTKTEKRKQTDKADERVTIWKDGKDYTFLVSRLVAMAWIPGFSDNLTVNHINGDPTDNRIENLEWVTRSKNIQLGFETGLYDSIKKPVLLISEKGNRIQYDSMSSASRALGRNAGYIYDCLIKNRVCRDIYGQQYSVERDTMS